MKGLRFKIITIVVLMLFICLPSGAQVGELRNNVAVGFNAGMNFNNVTFSPRIRQSQLLGLNGGVTVRFISELYFAMLCGLQVELNYSGRGWKELVEDDSGDTYNRSMTYVEVPFLTHLAFGKEKGIKIFLNLGPQVAFLTKEQEHISESWHPQQRRVREQYSMKADNTFDYGIVAGGGLEIWTAKGNILVEGRYYYGLSDFFNNGKKYYFSRSAHSAILGKVSYLFDIKK